MCSHRGLAERLRSSQVNPADVHKRMDCNELYTNVYNCKQSETDLVVY
jgi:hypothetical protein